MGAAGGVHYYLTADESLVMTAQPGQESISSQALLDWFWEETAAGKVLRQIKEASKKSQDPLMQIVGGMLIVPVSVVSRGGK